MTAHMPTTAQTNQDGTNEPNTFCAGAPLHAEHPAPTDSAVDRRAHPGTDERARKRPNDKGTMAGWAIMPKYPGASADLDSSTPFSARIEAERGDFKISNAASPPNRSMVWSASVKVVNLRMIDLSPR